MRNGLILFFVLLFASLTYADFYAAGTTFSPPSTNVTYTLVQDITCTNLTVTNLCLIIVGGSMEGTYCSNATTPTTLNLVTIHINFYDEQTDTPLTNTNITLEFISNTVTYNYSTSTGQLTINFTATEDYVLRYTSAEYGRKRHYYFTVSNQSFNNLTLYLLNNSVSSDIQVVVYDKVALNKVDGAFVYAQRYYQHDNAYKTVAMYETDPGGNAWFDLEKQTEKYKFIIDYPLRTTLLVTQPTYIEQDTLNLYIDFTSPIADLFINKEKIRASITYNNNTRIFSCTYNDFSLIGSNYCLNIKKYGHYGSEVLNRSCLSVQSGTIQLKHPEANATYYATFTADINGQTTTILTVFKDIGDKTPLGTFGVFLTAIIIILLAFVSGFHILALVIAMSGLVFSKLIGLLALDWGWILGLYALGLILTMILRAFYDR